MYPIEIPTALNQLHGPIVKMGQSTDSASQKETEQIKAAIEQPKVADSITTTAKPTTGDQVVSKMAANNALTVAPAVARANSGLLALLIKKGADPVQAAYVLNGLRAVEYTTCNQAIKSALFSDKAEIQKVMANPQIKTLLGRLKDLVFRNLVTPSPNIDLQIATISANVFTRATALVGNRLLNKDLLTCLVEGTRLEAEIEFDVLFGKDARMAMAQGELDPEQATALVESAAILEQAAEGGVAETEGVLAETDSDKKAMSLFQSKNMKYLLLVGLGLLWWRHRR